MGPPAITNLADKGDSPEQNDWVTCDSSCSSGRSKTFKMENSPSSYSSLESNCSDKQLWRIPKSIRFPDQNENFIKGKSQKKSEQKPPIDLDDSTCYWIRNKLPKEFRDTLEADNRFDDWLDHCMNRRAVDDTPVILTKAHQLDTNDHMLPLGVRLRSRSRRKRKRNMWWRKVQKAINRIVLHIIRFLRNLISYCQRKVGKL